MIIPDLATIDNPNQAGSFFTGPTNPIAPIDTPGRNQFKLDTQMDANLSNRVAPTFYVPLPQQTAGMLAFNPDYVTQLAEQQAYRNWLASIGLEKQFAPESEALRREATAGLLGDVQSGGQVMDPMVRQQLMATMAAQGQPMDTPYEALPQNEMYDLMRQQVLADLQLGGQLDRETQNLVGRASAQRAGAGGFLGGQIGRDISARDLGLTSMQLQQQRRAAAGGLAQQEMAQAAQQQGFKAALNQANQQMRQQQAGTQLQFGTMLTGADQQQFANRMGLAQFGQSIERPIGGIDPGALASAYIADVNQQNQLMMQSDVAAKQAAAARSAANSQMMGQAAGAAAALIIACWVAREIYGVDNPSWLMFRRWMLLDAPEWFRNVYCKHGERFAEWLKNEKGIKGKIVRWTVRKLMDRVVHNEALNMEVVWQ
jgi:hypothetical protein